MNKIIFKLKKRLLKNLIKQQIYHYNKIRSLNEKTIKLTNELKELIVNCNKCSNDYFMQQVEWDMQKNGVQYWICPNCNKKNKVKK